MNPMPNHDPDLAERGKSLLARLVEAAGAHEFYQTGSLFGAATADPKAAISVPLDAWKSLADEERTALMHYTASLVETMRADPFGYSQLPPDAPAADIIRSNAGNMGPGSWVIHGGRVEGQDILTDAPVASGEETDLTAK